MTLIRPSDIKLPAGETTAQHGYDSPVLEAPPIAGREFVNDRDIQLTKAIGLLSAGNEKHYYSHGNFNLMRLVFYLLKQTGPADIFLTTYSISQRTLEGIEQRVQNGLIRSIRFLIDNRVKVMSPVPFQYMKQNFNYRCISLHAKVALIENQDWQIAIITSQNATDNPKLERGIIYTIPEIFEFDKSVLEHEFERGTT
jgi:hypothetical protein